MSAVIVMVTLSFPHSSAILVKHDLGISSGLVGTLSWTALLLIAHPATERVGVCRSRFVKRWSHAFPHRTLLPASLVRRGQAQVVPRRRVSLLDRCRHLDRHERRDRRVATDLRHGHPGSSRRPLQHRRPHLKDDHVSMLEPHGVSDLPNPREPRNMRKNKRTPASRSLARVQ